MKNVLITIICCILLVGCATTVPVKQQFPVAPEILLEKCPQLLTVDDGKDTLRDILKIVIQNYSTYYQCASKTHGWQEWYQANKKIYEEANK